MNEILPVRVLLADQRVAVRSALRLIVTDAVGMQVVGEVADGADLWNWIESTEPEVLLLDWGMVAAQPGALVPALRARWPDLHIIALSWRPEVEPVALTAGAAAFVNKTDPPERLVQTLQEVGTRNSASGPPHP